MLHFLKRTVRTPAKTELGLCCSVENALAITCCSAAILLLVPVVLVQSRRMRRLPELPGGIFSSTRIVRSRSAYRFGIPDGLLGLISYSITLALLLAANPSRPGVRTLLRGKLLLDGAMAAHKSRSQLKRFDRICSWCMGVSLATGGMIYFARKARQAERLRAA